MNWGTGLAITIGAFMLMILLFVFGASKLQTELVSDNYYEKEIKFQETIDKQKNTNALEGNFEILGTVKSVKINLPKDLEGQEIEGTISLYRPSSEMLDFEVKAENSMEQVIESENLVAGKWTISIDITADGKGYYYEEKVYL